MKVFNVRVDEEWVELSARSDVEAIVETIHKWGLDKVDHILCSTYHHKIFKDYDLSLVTGERKPKHNTWGDRI